MSEKWNSVSDIFVKKLSEKKWKILTREAIADIWSLSGGSKSRFAYGLGKVKNQSLISSLGWGLYSLGSDFTEWDSHYWHIVAMLLLRYSPSGGIIAHEKSMEYHLHNYEIPRCLVLYTRDTDKRIRYEYMIYIFVPWRQDRNHEWEICIEFFIVSLLRDL